MLGWLYDILYTLRTWWWRAWGTKVRGVGGLILNGRDRVLLVQHSYGPNKDWWMLPGGQLRTGETPLHGLERELSEELGLQTFSGDELGVYSKNTDGVSETITVIIVHTLIANPVLKRNTEIKEAAWFARTALPSRVEPATQARLAEWQSGRRSLRGNW